MKGSSVLIAFTLLMVAHMGFSQSHLEDGRVIMERNPGSIIESFDLEKSSEVLGSYYLEPEWQIGSVFLYDKRSIEKVPLKYNMRDDFMHILDENEEIRVLKFDKIQLFEWFNMETKRLSVYVNCLDYELDGTSLVGFAQQLSEGEMELLRYKSLELKEGNYAITHDAGQKNDEYAIKDTRYISIDGKLKLANKKKHILNIMADKEDEINAYIKTNRLSLKNDDHLIAVIDYYKTL